MYVIYLDESGDPNAWSKQNHFIIGGIAIHEGQIRRLSNVLDDVQAEFFPGISVPLKFHAVDINSGRDRFRSICKSVRQRMLETVYDEIAKTAYPNAVLFATAMHISSVRHAEQALRGTFQDIAQRINTFLLRFHHQGKPQKGLLIIDRSQSTESRYRTLIADFRGEGTEHGYLHNIVDIPYFSQSSDTRLLQLADFCAYAVYRYYERNDGQFLKRILPRFDRRTPDYGPDGLKHIIKTDGLCQCVACSWRRPESLTSD